MNTKVLLLTAVGVTGFFYQNKPKQIKSMNTLPQSYCNKKDREALRKTQPYKTADALEILKKERDQFELMSLKWLIGEKSEELNNAISILEEPPIKTCDKSCGNLLFKKACSKAQEILIREIYRRSCVINKSNL